MAIKKRIGSILLEQGLITRSQLERALQAQLFAGGHLGTSLIELGFVDEDGLAQGLGRALNMRHVTREMMDTISPDVLELIDAQTVERFRVVPVGRGFRSVHVAMITPRETSTLSTRAGARIIPWIAPEISILEAMERYYDIPRPRRFLQLSRNHPSRVREAGAERSSSLSPIEEAALHAASPSGRPWEFADTRCDRPAATHSDTGFDAQAAVPRETEFEQPSRCLSFEDISELLSKVDCREEMGDVLLEYASQHMPGCALFGVSGPSAYLWNRRGLNFSPEDADATRGVPFPVARGSLFQLLGGEPFYHGPVPRQPQYLEFLENMRRPVPEEVLLIPVHLKDRLIAMFYGEGRPGAPITADLEDYLQLAAKVSMALNIIVLKMKIRVG